MTQVNNPRKGSFSKALREVTLGTGLVLSLWTSAAIADGMPPEGSYSHTIAATSSDEATRLDSAASQGRTDESRASMGEAPPIQGVHPEVLAAATGHYARARSLLVAALREFDSGLKLAKPDAILNSKEWRADLIARAEDLERILAPQARASRFGVRFEADPRLLGGEAK
jgi:hypothetical protein